ncbi:MAG: hypothetical protein COA78_05685 [Blastopirellula sp.]|nr:MAG: hypothetical protein COA78_05685 [Blastopirellula sp.]
MYKDPMNDLSYINGMLSVYAQFNCHSCDIGFDFQLKEIQNVNFPYARAGKVSLTRIDNWEDHLTVTLQTWLFAFMEEFNLDLKSLYFGCEENRQYSAKHLVELMRECLQPETVYQATGVDTGDFKYDSLVFESDDQNYLLYFGLSD